MTCYYNEIDPYAAQWLRNLIKEQLIADGDVDERSIEDVRPNDLRGYTQCHFFAGIGVWSHALRNAGWSDDRPVWTGSCPCFPAGTLITTSKGQVPIERVSAGDLVLTDKGRFMPVVRTGCDERKPLVKLRGQGHWGLVSTPNHPFLSRSQRRRGHAGRIELGEVEWVDASDMCGRRWAMPTSVETTLRVDSDCAFAKFAGFFVGNGWTSEDGHIFLCDSFDKSDEVDRVARGSGVSGKGCNERTAYRWRGRDCDLARWLNTEFGKGATNKQIPSWVFGAPVAWREAFLEGWLQADGHKQSLTTASRALAVSGRILLNTLGYAASVRWVDGRGVTVIEGREVADRGYYRLQFCENPKSFKFDTHGWGLVRSVEAAGFGTVFNMEVEDDNTYVADGIIVHNCQPFSSAGKGNGTADERHLWPAWYHLIRQCKPDVIFGEQVEAAIRYSWLDLVQTDLEGSGYTLGAVGLPAAGFGAPHIRQRLFFVADAVDIRQFKQWDSTTAALQGYGTERSGEYEESRLSGFVSRGSQGLGCTGELAHHHHHQGLEGRREPGCECAAERAAGTGRVVGGLADDQLQQRPNGKPGVGITHDSQRQVEGTATITGLCCGSVAGPTNGHWRDSDWLFCRDGKWRPVEPGTFPLAHGAPARVGRLRAYGNAIVAPVAEEFIRAYMSCQNQSPN